MSSEQQLGQSGIVIRTPSLFSCNPVWPGLPGALWSSPGSRKKGRGVYWGGSSESVLLPKGGDQNLWAPAAAMPRLQPMAGGGELGPGEPMRGQLAAFPSGPSQDGLLLLASSREWSPTNPKFPHSLGNVASEGLRSRMSTYCLAAGFSRAPQGGAVWRKPDPGVFSPPLTQTGEGTYCHLRAGTAHTSQHHLTESSQQPACKEVIALLSFLINTLSILALDFQKSSKDSTEFPVINICPYHGTFVTMHEPIRTH